MKVARKYVERRELGELRGLAHAFAVDPLPDMRSSRFHPRRKVGAGVKPLALLLLFLAGCAVHMHHPENRLAPWTPEQKVRCETLDRRVLALNLTTTIAGVGSGGAATGAGIFDGDARYALVGVGAALGLTGAITGYLSAWFAAKYAKECP